VIQMIHHQNRAMVIYKGHLTRPESCASVGNPALVIDGQAAPDRLDDRQGLRLVDVGQAPGELSEKGQLRGGGW
jgi:hypothetical protein